MIDIQKQDERLLLIYSSDGYNTVTWIDDKLMKEESITIRRTFLFEPEDLS